MKFDIIKQASLLFLATFFTFSCCSMKTKKTINVHIEVFDKSSNKPRIGLEVRIFEIKKPIFSRWQFHELDKTMTDSLGGCSFQTNKKGQYSLRFYDGKNLLYSTDDIEINDSNDGKFLVEW